jgi:Domain of unknown function (DUF4926)
MQELDTVVLTRSFPEHGLRKGDVGAVVHLYSGGKAFEVEFVTAAGETQALLTIKAEDVRPMAATEILHARELTQTAA